MLFSAAHTAGTICRHSVSDNTSSPCQGKGCRRKQVHGGTSVGAMPCCVWEFIGDSRFRRCSPVGGFKGDFHEPRISNVPVGTISARTPDSRKLPRRIRANRRKPGNPDSSPTSPARHRPNPGLPCLHRHWRSPQRRQTLLTTLTVTPASTNAPADTDNSSNVGRRF